MTLIKIIKVTYKVFVVFIFGTVSTACEGVNTANGIVRENATNKPLDSVLCKVIETGQEYYTDSAGNYIADGPFGSCIGECKDMTVEFSKSGYKSQKLVNPGKKTIYLEK
jgi:hypothetical protein